MQMAAIAGFPGVAEQRGRPGSRHGEIDVAKVPSPCCRKGDWRLPHMKSYFLSQFAQTPRLPKKSPMPAEVREAFERVIAAYRKCSNPPESAKILPFKANT